MVSEPYLIRLGTRLRDGLDRMDPDRRERHRSFILSQQKPDGGFSGREGDSDLYYTGFAIRSLAILGGLTPDDCARISPFIKAQTNRRLSVIDLVSWLYSALVVQAFGGDDPFENSDVDWPSRLPNS